MSSSYLGPSSPPTPNPGVSGIPAYGVGASPENFGVGAPIPDAAGVLATFPYPFAAGVGASYARAAGVGASKDFAAGVGAEAPKSLPGVGAS